MTDLEGFLDRLRRGLASIRGAIEALDAYPDAEPARVADLRRVIREEALALETLLQRGGGASMVELPVGELVGVVAEACQEVRGSAVKVETEAELPERPLRADPTAVAAALAGVVASLWDMFAVEHVLLRCRQGDEFIPLDLEWRFDPATAEAVIDWQRDALLGRPNEDAATPSLKEIARGHGGEVWCNLARDSDRAYIRLLLPRAADSSLQDSSRG